MAQTAAEKRRNAQPLFQRTKDERPVETPKVMIAPEKRLKIAGGRRHDTDPRYNSGIYTIPGWRGTWVSKDRVNDAIDCGIDIAEEGDERVTNQIRFRIHEMEGKRYLGRTDSLVGLITEEQYDQYLADLAAETQRKIDAEAGTVSKTELTREQLEQDVRAQDYVPQATLTPPPPQG